MRGHILAACTLLLGSTPVLPAPLVAQDVPTVTVGSRLRVTFIDRASRRMVSRLVERSGDTLMLAASDTSAAVAVPLDAVRTLEVSRGRGNRGASAVKGLLIGGFAGAALGFLAGDDCGANQWLCFDRGTMAASFGMSGAVAGAVGGVLGGGRERWEKLDAKTWRVAPYVGASGAVGVSASLAF
jgi:hypothetical protein